MIDEEIASVLDANRTALIGSVARLTDAQSRSRLVPSLTTPIALVKHCAAAERVWFQRTVAGLAHLRALTKPSYGFASPQALIAMAMATATLTRGGACPQLPHQNIMRALRPPVDE